MTEGHVVYPSNPSHTGYPSYPPYHDSLSNQTRKAWHPKITPYRLAILTTTVGLGTAKAIVTQNGGAIVSTTLEWVAGMLLSLLFLVLSDYESREDVVPLYLSWLFKPDCMDLVWKLLAFFSIDRPVYVSDELPSDSASDDAKSASPDLTPYRILVSGTVTAFGLSKAMLGYSNQSTAVTWTDWALAVPVTTLLYVLGLYEYNSTKVLPDLFCGDQSEILKSAARGVLYSVGIIISSVWASRWTHILYRFSADFLLVSDLAPLPEGKAKATTLQEHIATWQAVLLKLWLQESLVALIGLGACVLFLASRHIAKDITARSGVVRRILRTIRRPIIRALHLVFPSIPDNPLSISSETSEAIRVVWERIKSFLRVAFHLGYHLSGIIFTLSISVLSILTCIMPMLEYSWKDPFLYATIWLTLSSLILFYIPYNIGKSMLVTWPTIRRT